MRRNYVRDRTQAALTYISEYDVTQKWEGDPQYDQQQVRQRLQIVYGKANQVRERIDTALNSDDIHRRWRMMRTLGLQKRFPQPQNMKDSPVTTWITWIRDESNELITAIDEEVTKRQDPDDPFDGTASGIFLPLQQGNEAPPQQQCIQQVDESKDRNPQKKESAEGRLAEIQSLGVQPNHHRTTERDEHGVAPQPETQQGIRETDVADSSTNRQEVRPKQRKGELLNGQLPTQKMTQRQIEQSHTSSIIREQQVEDPFRTLRSFHEKQRGERQQNNTHQITLHSTFEGAVGGVGADQPKPQRVTKRHQQQDQPQDRMQNQEINHSRQDNYMQGSQNTTTYMNLPNSMQNKICGRCGLIGHIKRMCKEEVYCRYCKAYTHAMTACRTYPVTSSRKNTPEKRTVEDIEREVSRRVQEEMRRILNDLSTSRRVASTQQTLQTNQSSE